MSQMKAALDLLADALIEKATAVRSWSENVVEQQYEPHHALGLIATTAAIQQEAAVIRGHVAATLLFCKRGGS